MSVSTLIGGRPHPILACLPAACLLLFVSTPLAHCAQVRPKAEGSLAAVAAQATASAALSRFAAPVPAGAEYSSFELCAGSAAVATSVSECHHSITTAWLACIPGLLGTPPTFPFRAPSFSPFFAPPLCRCYHRHPAPRFSGAPARRLWRRRLRCPLQEWTARLAAPRAWPAPLYCSRACLL